MLEAPGIVPVEVKLVGIVGLTSSLLEASKDPAIVALGASLELDVVVKGGVPNLMDVSSNLQVVDRGSRLVTVRLFFEGRDHVDCNVFIILC